jgi:myo-inositol 2-dehydrogenase/D-chiro-inositol 1-dehydrogenase
MATGKVKVGIIGSQFEADIHAASFQIMPEEAEVVAVASPSAGHAEELAARYGIPRVFRDYREMLKESDIEMVTITAPNSLHKQMTVDIAGAGKHVVCEKPMAMTLEEADEMIDVCRREGKLLMYAEELFFTPKYVKAKEMADQGAFGKVHLVKQSEKHFGPHAAWFWDVNAPAAACSWTWAATESRSATGSLGRSPGQSVHLSNGHLRSWRQDRGDDDSDSASWNLPTEAWAWWRTVGPSAAAWTIAPRYTAKAANQLPKSAHGQRHADLQRIRLRIRRGKSAPPAAGAIRFSTSFGTMVSPHEMRHFARCVRGKESSQSTGEDGRVVMEIICAGYASAGKGSKVALPYAPKGLRKPIDGWRGAPAK